jgi:hypothetical protein
MDQSDTFSRQFSSFYVEDGSYVRLRNLQVGYTFPGAALSRMGMSNLRLFLQGQNLFTITGYSGIDPALPTISTNNATGNVADQSAGIDRGTYPTNRIFSFGVSASF